jgi:mannose/fructose/N-acetylgalactosamine-specific phosphotransferase system component IIC
MEFTTVGGLMLWGAVVGLDLATIAQVMIARPLVAGVVAGWIIGDVQAGLIVGAILELFALEVLPFGAARYPDYGLGAVAAAATAGGAPGVFGIGTGVAVGLLIAYLGEIAIQLVRQRTAVDVARHREVIDSGDIRVIYRLHLRGIVRDAARAIALTGLGLLLAAGVRIAMPLDVRGTVLLSAVAMGVGLGTTLVSGTKIARDARGGLVWLAAGLLAGVAWVVVR